MNPGDDDRVADQMTGWMSFPRVGIVGASFLDPDHSIQHAGVVVSPGEGALQHFQSALLANDPGYRSWPHLVREVSAVTGACLLTTTELFHSLGGSMKENFAVQFNDIDLCLRARQAGTHVVYEPSAVLHHVTSATRGRESITTRRCDSSRNTRAIGNPFDQPTSGRGLRPVPTPTRPVAVISTVVWRVGMPVPAVHATLPASICSERGPAFRP